MKINRKGIILVLIVIVTFAGTILINSCVHQPYVLPVDQQTGDPTICFERDILPIFQSNCAKSGCHNAASHEEGYTLDSYENIVRRGIVRGNPAASKIWQSVTTNKGEKFMPQNAPALSAASLDKIKRWILAGAVDTGGCNTISCDTNSFTYSGAIAPLMQTYCVGCHNGPSVPGGSLVDYASVKEAAVNGNLIPDISHTPGYNAMPQGGSKLLDCQITQVKKWVAAGAPNN
jgi:mono/diheme cytochrome c family protein